MVLQAGVGEGKEKKLLARAGSGGELTADPKPLQGPPQGKEAKTLGKGEASSS